ncbi:hypothetical protein T492DRAFT_155464 [Pavlovales sp. CCMP2436]|nr:hypothetical protein T492DRAFT_155464 [Pavlovales sp. CCMP2436]
MSFGLSPDWGWGGGWGGSIGSTDEGINPGNTIRGLSPGSAEVDPRFRGSPGRLRESPGHRVDPRVRGSPERLRESPGHRASPFRAFSGGPRDIVAVTTRRSCFVSQGDYGGLRRLGAETKPLGQQALDQAGVGVSRVRRPPGRGFQAAQVRGSGAKLLRRSSPRRWVLDGGRGALALLM